jgi:hypothetical protein
LRRHERWLLEQTLTRHRGDVQAVREELDLPRRTRNEKMARPRLERKNFSCARERQDLADCPVGFSRILPILPSSSPQTLFYPLY